VLGLFRWLRGGEKDNSYYKGRAKQFAFIVGTGRCGTTILAQVLNAHTKICVPHELQIIVSIGNGERLYEKYIAGEFDHFRAKDFIQLIDKCCPYRFDMFFDYRQHFNNLTYPQNDLRDILTDLFDHICHHYQKEIFIEQTPWYGQKLNVLREIFPNMKIIHLVRDARDVAISYSRTPWWSKDINHNLQQWEREINIIHAFGMENLDNFLEIRYEDLVMNPEQELKKILTLLGVEFEETMLKPENLIDYAHMFKGDLLSGRSTVYHNWAQKKNVIFFKESVYAWKRDARCKDIILTPVIQNTLRHFGYEL